MSGKSSSKHSAVRASQIVRSSSQMELSRHLIHAQEEERKRISRELHDETGQGLMLLRMHLDALAMESRGGAAVKVRFEEALGLLDHTIENLRRLIGHLSPRVLEELGLLPAIRKQARDLSRNTGIKTILALPETLNDLDEGTEITIYRTVQEALHNAARHSQAKVCRIKLDASAGFVSLTVEDDGSGFSRHRGTTSQNFGLLGMRDRIAALGGTLRIRSPKGKGTRIQAKLPVNSGQEKDTHTRQEVKNAAA